MKTNNDALLIALLLCFSWQLSAQIEGVSSEIIAKAGIVSTSASLDVYTDDPIYEGLEVAAFRFDQEGKCVYKMRLYPFYDVVATANEYYTYYNENGQIGRVSEMTIPVSEMTIQSPEFIRSFESNI